MPRWFWWLPLGVLTVVAGLFLFRAGWIVANLTETDVINHFAARYVADQGEGARMTDCTAVPAADPGIWLVVRCGGKVSYPVDRFGRLVAPRPAPPSL
jgi:hypothetical protein